MTTNYLTVKPREYINPNFLYTVWAAGFGSAFQYGYNIGVTNVAEAVLQRWLLEILPDESKYIDDFLSFSVSVVPLGAIIGAAGTAQIYSFVGPKTALMYNNGVAIIGLILTLVCKMIESSAIFFTGRFIIGISCGLSMGLCPMYLQDISPTHMRGAVTGGVFAFFVAFSLMIAFVLGQPAVFGTDRNWAFLYIIPIFPAILQLLTLCCCPESPKFLMITKHDPVEAETALVWLRNSVHVHDELDELHDEYSLLSVPVTTSFGSRFLDRRVLHPLIISLGVVVGHHLCGITAMIFFSTRMFTQIRLPEIGVYSNCLGGVVNFLTAFGSIFLIDRVGRRHLLMFSLLGLAFSILILLLSYEFAAHSESIVARYFVAFSYTICLGAYGIGIPSVTYVLPCELFGYRIRGAAVTITTTLQFLVGFIIAESWMTLQNSISFHHLVIGLIANLLLLIFVVFYVPETRQRPILTIIKYFEKDN